MSGFTLSCENLIFTITQLHILTLMANMGMTDKEIAQTLGNGLQTIKNHLYDLRQENEITINGPHLPSTIELIVRSERVGVLHPEFLPYIQETFLVPKK